VFGLLSNEAEMICFKMTLTCQQAKQEMDQNQIYLCSYLCRSEGLGFDKLVWSSGSKLIINYVENNHSV
jgi:hypothetical protein